MFRAEKELKRAEIIVNAMTEEERKNPDLITIMVSATTSA